MVVKSKYWYVVYLVWFCLFFSKVEFGWQKSDGRSHTVKTSVDHIDPCCVMVRWYWHWETFEVQDLSRQSLPQQNWQGEVYIHTLFNPLSGLVGLTWSSILYRYQLNISLIGTIADLSTERVTVLLLLRRPHHQHRERHRLQPVLPQSQQRWRAVHPHPNCTLIFSSP